MKVFLALAFAALAVTTAAEASLVVGNSLTGPFGIGTNYGLKAAGFTTGAASTHVNAVGVALTGAVGSIQLDGTISFTINGDLSGAPGAALTSVSSFTLAPNAPPAVYSFSPVSLTLAPNTKYWLVGTFANSQFANWNPTAPAAFPTNGLATFVGYKFDSSGTGNSYIASGVFNAFQIDGTSTTTATPEPASLAMIVGGGSLIFLSRKRRQA